MYVPQHHAESDPGILQALIQAYPLGTWVTQGDGELVANAIPFLFDPSRGEHGTLTAHVARANLAWHSFSKTVPSLVIFQGPQNYITPSLYPGKREHGKAVPTWNYAVVQAHGWPRAIEDPDWLLKHVTQLTDTHEVTQKLPWKVTDAPPDYINRMLQAIVGIEIPLTRLTGKWKVSQNRSPADKLGVVAGLLAREDSAATAMANLVRHHAEQTTPGSAS